MYNAKPGALDFNFFIEKFMTKPEYTVAMASGAQNHYLPTDKFFMTIDSASVCSNGTVDLKRYSPVKSLRWKIQRRSSRSDSVHLYKHELMLYDLIATNKFKRPIYFAYPESVKDVLAVGNLFYKKEGYANRLIPAMPLPGSNISPDVNTDIMYTNVMTKFKWGNLSKKGVYVDPESLHMVWSSRGMFAQLAIALIKEGKPEKARKALDKCIEVFPDNAIAYEYSTLGIIDAYYRLGDVEKANDIVKRLFDVTDRELKYFMRFVNTRLEEEAKNKLGDNLDMLGNLISLTRNYKQNDLALKMKKKMEDYERKIDPNFGQQQGPQIQQVPQQEMPVTE